MSIKPAAISQKTKGIIFGIMGLSGCQDTQLEDTKIPAKNIQALRDKIAKAPKKGVIVVTGTCCPIVNELFNDGRTIVGFSFSEYYDARFSSENEVDKPKPAKVVVLRSVGKEPAKNFEYSTKLIQGIMEYYANSLLIIETHLTKNAFETTYGIIVANHVSLLKKEEEPWLS